MIQYYRSTIQGPKIKKQSKLIAGSWLRAESPSESELARLLDLGLDDDTLHDALDPYEVPRLERDGDWTYYIARLPDANDELGGFTTPIMFALSGRYIVTLSRDKLAALWTPFAHKNSVPTTQRGKLFLAMISAIIEPYERQVALINRRMREVTLDVSNIHTRDIAVFTRNERMINDYLDALIPMNIALEKMLGSKLLGLFDNDADMVEDLSIDLEQLIVRCKSQLRTITNLRDSYRAVMDARLNETMRTLTVITVILTVPTMVAGLFGMNVDLPGQVDSPLFFWLLIIVTFLISLSIGVYFLRRR